MSGAAQGQPGGWTKIYNTQMPPEGPLCIPVNLDFSTVGAIEVDFTTLFNNRVISAIQTLIIRNFNNPNNLTVNIQGSNEYLDIPAGADCCLPVLASNRAKFLFTTTSGVIIPIEFVNVALPAYVLFKPGTQVVTITGTILIAPQLVTGSAGAATSVAVGGTAVTAIAATTAQGGAFIINPTSATEPLFVDPVTTAGSAEGTPATTQVLQPGQQFAVPPGFNGAVSVNAATAGHGFIVVRYHP